MINDFESTKAAMADFIYKHWPIRIIVDLKGYDDDLNEWIGDYVSCCARAWMTVGGGKWSE